MQYKDIPPHVRRYIQVSENDFNACPESVQNILYSQAQEEASYWASQEDAARQQAIDLSSWEWSGKYYERTFLRHKYRDYMYAGSTQSPLIMTSENIHSLCETVDDIGAAHIPEETWYSYEVTLTTSHGHINASLGNLLGAIIKNTETYNDDFLEISKIIIRYTSHDNRIHSASKLHAGSGEGIPIKLENGFWLLDLFKSKSLCIINCYLTWQWYRNGRVDSIFKNRYKQFCQERDEIRKTVRGKSISVEKLNEKYPHDYTILFETDKLQPEDTLNKCTYLYKNGHMFLVAHENYIKDMSFIRTKAKQTFVSKITPKKIPKFTTDINVMDIESYRNLVDDKYCHEPLMIGHIYKGKYECFKGDSCLLDYLKRIAATVKKDTVIWAHNGGRYDFHLLIEDAMKISDSDLNCPIEVLDIHGKYIQMTVHLPSGIKLYFRDSYSLIPSALDKIAKDFRIEGKLKEDGIDIVNVTRDQLLSDEKYVKYNKQDCRLLRKILDMYRAQCIKAFNIDPLNHPSASSYGKRVFYSQFYNAAKYPLYTLPQNVLSFINKSYGGGRCEVFYRGLYEQALNYYDINSPYPHAGCSLLPYGKPKRLENLHRISNVNKFLSMHPGFYEVKVKRCGPGKPIHGIMHEGKYIFPKFDSDSPSIVLFSEEIKYGLSLEWDYQLLQGYEFKLGRWGKDFFERMYDEKLKAKKDNNKALEYAYKITANSSYGFFGYDKYDRHVTKVYGKHMIEHVKCLEYNAKASFHEYDDEILVYENTNVLLEDVNIAVASAITSYDRIHLHKLMNAVEQNNGTVYYVDTDSLITDLKIEEIPSLKHLIGDKLGQLKSELKPDDVITKAVFVSCKLYGFETSKGKVEAHAKGVRNKELDATVKKELELKFKKELNSISKKELDLKVKKELDLIVKKELFNDLVNMLSEPVTFEVSSMFIGRTTKTKGDLNVYDKKVAKKLSGTYSKRIVLETGQTIELMYR